MEKMNRTKVLTGIIVFLLVTNVTTIITGILRSPSTGNEVTPGIEVPQNQRAAFFQEQLGLSDQQKKDFMKFNLEFNEKAGKLTTKMNSLRYKMVDELALPKPGNDNLEKINRQIGDLHYELKMETSAYYIKLKSVCDETQQKKLYELFRVMADPLGDITTIRPRAGGTGDMRSRRGSLPGGNQQNSNLRQTR
jgi:hypothetical protein